jgi:1,4-alpha-glucan branching enzyme
MAAHIHSSSSPSLSPSLSIVLHAHVPYVLNHGHWPHGSDWLYRATAESLIPLLNLLNRLIEDEVSPRLTIGISPILCEMLADLHFADEFDKYLQGRIDQTTHNARELAAQGFEEFRSLALFWENWYTGIDRDFDETYNRNLLGAFRALNEDGHIELVTAPATQAFLPLLGSTAAIEAQVRVGVESFRKHFARQPRGNVLPSALDEGH